MVHLGELKGLTCLLPSWYLCAVLENARESTEVTPRGLPRASLPSPQGCRNSPSASSPNHLDHFPPPRSRSVPQVLGSDHRLPGAPLEAEAWRGCRVPQPVSAGVGLEPQCPHVFCALTYQPVLVAEDKADHEKIPELSRDPDQENKKAPGFRSGDNYNSC